MIVACNSCPSQYSVPDAKVRGKKVRITCKHCGAPIVVDGSNMPAAAALDAVPPAPRLKPLAPLPVPVPKIDANHPDEVTLIARPKFGENLSVHDEPTVIGQIPREALDFEKNLAKPADAPAAPAAVAALARPVALPELPESPRDDTKRASPRAFARSEPPIAPILTTPVPPIHPSVPPAPAPLPTVMIKDTRDEPTLISRSLSRSRSPAATPAPQPRWQVARVALMLIALVLVSILILKLR